MPAATSALTDGYSTTYSFAADTTIELEEIEVTPPSIKGGGPISLSTMLNSAVRTQGPKSLYSVGQIAVTVAYDESKLADIIALVQVNNLLTITFPSGNKWNLWAWLEEFNPTGNKEGERPTANLVIEVSNRNASNVETPPAYLAGT